MGAAKAAKAACPKCGGRMAYDGSCVMCGQLLWESGYIAPKRCPACGATAPFVGDVCASCARRGVAWSAADLERQAVEARKAAAREKRREYMREYMREYDQLPKMKAYRREYWQRPEVKARRRERDRKRYEAEADRKREYMREYNQRPEVKARRREYDRKRYQARKEAEADRKLPMKEGTP